MKRIFVVSLATVVLLVNLRYQGVATSISSVDNAIAQLMTSIGLFVN